MNAEHVGMGVPACRSRSVTGSQAPRPDDRSTSRLAAQARMLEIAGSAARVIPGHDPAVFERFLKPGDGVARIAR